MAKVKIKGWDTGFNRQRMTEILIESLALEGPQADELLDAVADGKVISLDIDDQAFADELAARLHAVGAIIEVDKVEIVP